MIISRPGIAPRNTETLPSPAAQPLKPSANLTPEEIWALPVEQRPFLSIPDAIRAAEMRHAMTDPSLKQILPTPPREPDDAHLREPLLK